MYHIRVIGDSISTFIYDKSFIAINTKDSTISVKKNLLSNDTTVYIKVVCKDSSLVDSTAIIIKKKLNLSQKSSSKNEFQKNIENINKELKDSIINSGSSDSINKITPAIGKESQVTKLKKKTKKK